MHYRYSATGRDLWTRPIFLKATCKTTGRDLQFRITCVYEESILTPLNSNPVDLIRNHFSNYGNLGTTPLRFAVVLVNSNPLQGFKSF